MSTIDEQIKKLEKLKKHDDYLAPLEAELVEHYSHVDAGELVLKPRIERIDWDIELNFYVWMNVFTPDDHILFSAFNSYYGKAAWNVTVEQLIRDLNKEFNRNLAQARTVATALPNGLGVTE